MLRIENNQIVLSHSEINININPYKYIFDSDYYRDEIFLKYIVPPEDLEIIISIEKTYGKHIAKIVFNKLVKHMTEKIDKVVFDYIQNTL